MTIRFVARLGFALFLTTASPANAQFDVLHSFQSTGGVRATGLLRGSDGNVYGSMSTDTGSALFRVNADQSLTTIREFPGLFVLLAAHSAAGAFFGTMQGTTFTSGAIYKVSESGVLTTLHEFSSEEGRPGALTLASDGNLYGIAIEPANIAVSRVFRLAPDGAFTVLRVLNAMGDPAFVSGLVEGPDGALYGASSYEVTLSGGIVGGGTVFRLTTDGALTILHAFRNGADGFIAGAAKLIVGSDGALYGATLFGGTSGFGTAYRITTIGALTVLRSFSSADGGASSGLVSGDDGALYGSTQGTFGPSVAFRLTTSGQFTVVHTFSALEGTTGGMPLAVAKSGLLYGLTRSGGEFGLGVIFSLSAEGALSALLHHRGPASGTRPATIVRAPDGSIFGITSSGGPFDRGTLFRFDADGTLTTLHVFTAAQGSPVTLLLGRDGFLYGIAHGSGTSASDTVFRFGIGGSLTTLHAFTAAEGSFPSSLIEGLDGALYGTLRNGSPTASGGMIYRLTKAGDFSVVRGFTAGTSVSIPTSLMQASDGAFYGTAINATGGFGAVFRMTAAEDITIIHTFTGADGVFPRFPLVEHTDGNLYGVVTGAGIPPFFNGPGVAFMIDSSGAFNLLHRFGGPEGIEPIGLTSSPTGRLYGTTRTSLFELTASGEVRVIHFFDRAAPTVAAISDGAGNLFGTTATGGAHGGGVLYRAHSSAGDGVAGPLGGVILDDVFGSRASVTIPAGIISASTIVSIEVLETPLDVPLPTGFATASYFTRIELSPAPSFPLAAPGLTLVLPLAQPLPVGDLLYLFRLENGALMPSLDAAGNPIVGTVNADGQSATFTGITHLSTVVGLLASPVAPTITWSTPDSIVVGTPLGAMQLNAVTETDGAFSYQPTTGAVLPVGTHTLSAPFEPANPRRFTRAEAHVQLQVSYAICVLYEEGRAVKAGATVPVKLSLCDSEGRNVSAPAAEVHALGLVRESTDASGALMDAGNSNPDADFRFDASVVPGGGYIFNLKTTGLAMGTYLLRFSVSGDPKAHTVRFKVR